MILHSTIDNEFTEIVNDKLSKKLSPQTPVLSESDALSHALLEFKSNKYAWQDSLEEAELKEETKNQSETYFPKGVLIYAKEKNKPQQKESYQLCYKFVVFSLSPLYKKAVYIDAVTGKVFKDVDLLIKCNDPATATTVYNGNQQIITDWKAFPWNRYILIDCANRNIHTKYGNSGNPEAENSTTTWATNHQNATSAHWAAEMTWDLYSTVYGRNGTNNSNRQVKVLVDYTGLIDNAYYEYSGGGNDKVRVGTTSVGNRTIASLDVIGHEITHGLTNATADLAYENESGALNESFSDIFGFMVERRSQPNFNWLIGEAPFVDNQIFIRDLQNPNLSGFAQPVIYHGTNWEFGTGDDGGVHTNSGVQNRWFFLLSNGGFQNGVNVTGIGIDNAALIAWNTLVFNLGQNSNYSDSRIASINATKWLFGDCSNELIQVTNAWAAVGVGNPWQVQAINLTPSYSMDCNTVTLLAGIPTYSTVTWTTTNGLLINGNSSPVTLQGNSVDISSPSGLGGNITATVAGGCQQNVFSFCPCVSWDYPVVSWISSSPMPGEPLEAEVIPAHPDALYYQWYIDGELVEVTTSAVLSTFNWPCTSFGEGLSVIAITPCGATASVNGGPYNPICYGKISSNVKLYPNPATSKVTVSLEKLKSSDKTNSSSGQYVILSEIAQIKFIDKAGTVKKVMRFEKGNQTVTFNIFDLSPDVYYIEISDNKLHTMTTTLMIQK